MLEKILKAIIEGAFYYFFGVGMVAIGWNVIFVYLFNVPVFNFGKLCLFALAINLLASPITLSKQFRPKSE